MNEFFILPERLPPDQPADPAEMSRVLETAQVRWQARDEDTPAREAMLAKLADAQLRLQEFGGNTQGELIGWMRKTLAACHAVAFQNAEISGDSPVLSLGESLARWAKRGEGEARHSHSQASRREETMLLLARQLSGLSPQQRAALDGREFLRQGWEDVAQATGGDVRLAKRLWVQSLLQASAGWECGR